MKKIIAIVCALIMLVGSLLFAVSCSDDTPATPPASTPGTDTDTGTKPGNSDTDIGGTDTDTDTNTDSSSDTDTNTDTGTDTGADSSTDTDTNGPDTPTPDVPTGDFEFSFNNGGYYVTKYLGTDTEIVIPSQYESTPVIGISGLLDYGSELAITSVTMPDTIEVIEYNAFSGMKSLKEINLSSALTRIGYYAFNECTALEEIVIPEGVTVLEESVFANCTSLRSVDIKNVSEIKYGAFSGCSNLREFKIGSNLTSWNSDAFYDAPLSSVTVDEANEHFEIIENCLIYKDESAVIRVFEGFSIPSTATTIYPYAFYSYTEATELVIPDNITSMAYASLYGLTKLKSISLPFVGDSVNAYSNSTLISLFGGSVDDYYLSCLYPEGLKEVTVRGGALRKDAFKFFYDIKKITIESGVTQIDSSALYQCDSLEELTIPFVGTSNEQFFGALFARSEWGVPETKNNLDAYIPTSLKKVTVLGGEIGDNAFAYCFQIRELILDSSITAIGDKAFAYCYALKKLSVSDNLTSLGENVFLGCTDALTEYSNAYYIGNENNPYVALVSAKSKDIDSCSVNQNTRVIAKSAFEGCTSLTEMVIPSGVKTVGGNAFLYCNNLLTVTIGSGVLSIGDGCFNGCQKLIEVVNLSLCDGFYAIGDIHNGPASKIEVSDGFKFYKVLNEDKGINEYYLVDYTGTDEEVTLPEYYKGTPYKIWYHAFYNKDTITKLTIPSKVEYADNLAFDGCTGIKEIKCHANIIKLIPKNSLEIVTISGGEVIPSYALADATKLTTIEIPYYINTISSHAFSNCVALKNVTLPEELVKIESNAFDGCTSLEEVVMSDALEEIGGGAFYGCKSLKSFTVGKSVKEIGDSAFFDCISLKSITNKSDLTLAAANNGDIGYFAVVIDKDSPNISKDGDWLVYHNYAQSNYYIVGYTGNDRYVKIPDKYNNLVISKHVFSGKNNIFSITFPATVVEIQDGAFADCHGLKQIIFEESENNINISSSAFENCSVAEIINRRSLSTSYLPEYLTLHSQENSKLKTTEDGFVYYGSRIVGYTGNDEIVFVPETVSGSSFYTIGAYAFAGSTMECLMISSQDVEFEDNCFALCTSLRELATPVTENLYYAFGGKFPSSLKKVVLSGERIELYALNGASSVEEIVLCEGVKYIDTQAFMNCKSLTKVTFPSSLVAMSSSVFSGCSSLKEITLPDSLTDYSTSTFYECTGLEKVVFGSGVTSIREYTFYGCTSLKEVVFGSNITTIEECAFSKCGLEKIVIPDTVKLVESRVFSLCENLKEIVFPVGVKIEYAALGGCSSIESITLPLTISEYTVDSQYTKIYVPFGYIFGEDVEGVTYDVSVSYGSSFGTQYIPFSLRKVVIIGDTIPGGAISGLKSVVEIVLNNDLTYVAAGGLNDSMDYTVYENGIYYGTEENPYFILADVIDKSVSTLVIHKDTKHIAFGNIKMKNIESIELPVGIISISEWAFAGFESLKEIVIPEGVLYIGEYAFDYCTALEKITLPSTLISVGDSAFNGCNALKNVTFPDGIKYIGSYVGNYDEESGENTYNVYENGLYIGTENNPYHYLVGVMDFSVTSFKIHEDTVVIGRYALSDCEALEEISFGNKIQRIEEYAFSRCYALTSLYISDSVEIIGRGAFENCTGLLEVYIGKGVKHVGENIFSYEVCPTKITVPANLAGVIGISYDNAVSLTLRGGKELVSGNFNYFEALEELTIEDVQIIGGSCFNSLPNLKKINLGEGLVEIGGGCFYQLSSLESITFPESLELIGIGTLQNSNNLKYVYVGKNTVVENNFLEYCDSVKELTICASSLPSVSGYNFSLTRLTLTGVERLEREYFESCRSFEELILDSSIKSIGDYALSNLISLKSVTFNGDLEYIGEGAFFQATALEEIHIPATVTYIGADAFYEITGTVYFDVTEAGEGWDESWNDGLSDGSIVWKEA